MFLSSHNEPGISSEERNPSTTYPSTRDEGLDTDRSKGDSTDGLDDAEPLIQSVIGLDGFKEVIMLPIWIVNDFISTIKQTHFKTLKERY